MECIFFEALLVLLILLFGGRDKVKDITTLNTKVLVASVVLTLPFVICGSFFWISAGSVTDNPGMQLSGYELGDLLYQLGFPLTRFVLDFGKYAGRNLGPSDDLWAVPLVDILFILQWIIWGQLLVFGTRLLRFILTKRV